MPCLPISKWKATWNGCCCGFSIRTVKPKEAKALLDDPTLSNIEPQLLVNLNNANTNVTNTSNLLEAEVDGFDTLPEPVSIEVQDCNVAPFSLPQECLNYVPDPNAVVLKFQNGESERMISCNTELSKDELSMLRKCQEEAARQKLAFLPSISIAAVRYLGDIGDVEEAVKKMHENQAWRLSYFQKPLQDFEMFLGCGKRQHRCQHANMSSHRKRFQRELCKSVCKVVYHVETSREH